MLPNILGTLIELTDAELDAVSGGGKKYGHNKSVKIEDSVIVAQSADDDGVNLAIVANNGSKIKLKDVTFNITT